LKLCKKYAIQSITEDEDDQINDYFNLDLAGIETTTENSKYIGCDINNKLIFDSNIIDSKQIILNADMGKGKTQYCKYIINQNIKFARRKTPSILFITCRQSFANFVCDTFSDYQINNYLDFIKDATKYNNYKRLCFQLESLLKVDKTIRYDYIFIDDSESVLKQFSSTTIKHTIDIFNALSNIIKRSSKVIYADAFISNRTLNFVRDMRKKKENTYMIHNIEPRLKDKIAKQVKGTDFNNMILTMLTEKKNIYIASTSKTKLNALEQHQNIIVKVFITMVQIVNSPTIRLKM
jgi:hypothetical protein